MESWAPVAKYRDGTSNRSLPKSSAVGILQITEREGCPQQTNVTPSIGSMKMCEDASSESNIIHCRLQFYQAQSLCVHTAILMDKKMEAQKKCFLYRFFKNSE
jgi:hypothetical protein